MLPVIVQKHDVWILKRTRHCYKHLIKVSCNLWFVGLRGLKSTYTDAIDLIVCMDFSNYFLTEKSVTFTPYILLNNKQKNICDNTDIRNT